VEDLDSRNGTLLNLEILSTPAVVVSGDELQLGQVIINIEIGESENHSPVAVSKG
jgi:pSer/pThr/pTyr-binding forkhead associated (FHA) protein